MSDYRIFREYDVHLEEGYCIIRSTGEKIYASNEVLKLIQKDQWREMASYQNYHDRTLSYNNPIAATGDEHLELLAGPKKYETEYLFKENEFLKIMLKAIENYPEKTRKIGQLYLFDQMTEKEIGDEMHCSPQLAHYHKKKFLNNLRNEEEIKNWHDEYYNEK